jgi:hypothetical protein
MDNHGTVNNVYIRRLIPFIIMAKAHFNKLYNRPIIYSLYCHVGEGELQPLYL